MSMKLAPSFPRGRGARENPPNRFEEIRYEPDADADWLAEERPLSHTKFYRDLSQSLITYNDSPDIGFGAGINPYRGCEHGCAYCYARPYHEHIGFSAGLDFETKIMVKENAPEILRGELSSPRWKPQTLAMSGVTDCYQPIEHKLRLTRRCLEVLAEFRNPVSIITKNWLVTRDLDLLGELARHHAACVQISLTTLDPQLALLLEPRTSIPARRLDAVTKLSRVGIPVGVLVAPVLPAINDHQIPSILAAAAAAGARFAGYSLLRLPHGVKDLFADWLARHFPDRREKVMSAIRALRGGKFNDARFVRRMSGEGIWAEQLEKMFDVFRRRAGLSERGPELSAAAFRRPTGSQLELIGF